VKISSPKKVNKRPSIGNFFGMPPPIRLPNAEEQHVLDELQVRLIGEEELPRWNELVTQEHYLGNATLVGEPRRYVVEYQGQWLALIGWSAPARQPPEGERVSGTRV
jgi:hypothetical protein